mmetsp:Transcript_4708/g.19203  ORF Transcript_4708/g.19203 Transcript_4708/m.19203 type:complete len:232 (-) Transcript_4708:23-718(-)
MANRATKTATRSRGGRRTRIRANAPPRCPSQTARSSRGRCNASTTSSARGSTAACRTFTKPTTRSDGTPTTSGLWFPARRSRRCRAVRRDASSSRPNRTTPIGTRTAPRPRSSTSPWPTAISASWAGPAKRRTATRSPNRARRTPTPWVDASRGPSASSRPSSSPAMTTPGWPMRLTTQAQLTTRTSPSPHRMKKARPRSVPGGLHRRKMWSSERSSRVDTPTCSVLIWRL